MDGDRRCGCFGVNQLHPTTDCYDPHPPDQHFDPRAFFLHRNGRDGDAGCLDRSWIHGLELLVGHSLRDRRRSHQLVFDPSGVLSIASELSHLVCEGFEGNLLLEPSRCSPSSLTDSFPDGPSVLVYVAGNLAYRAWKTSKKILKSLSTFYYRYYSQLE